MYGTATSAWSAYEHCIAKKYVVERVDRLLGRGLGAEHRHLVGLDLLDRGDLQARVVEADDAERRRLAHELLVRGEARRDFVLLVLHQQLDRAAVDAAGLVDGLDLGLDALGERHLDGGGGAGEVGDHADADLFGGHAFLDRAGAAGAAAASFGLSAPHAATPIARSTARPPPAALARNLPTVAPPPSGLSPIDPAMCTTRIPEKANDRLVEEVSGWLVRSGRSRPTCRR